MLPVSSAVGSRVAIAACVALLLATPSSPSFAQTDPWIGTWRLNVAKSTFNPGPGPRAVTVTYESAPGGYRAVVELIDAQGRQQRSEWPAIYDGRRHRVTGAPATDEVTSRLIDPYTEQAEFFKDGQPDGTATFVVSRDGKIITQISRRLLGNGRESNVVAIFEKQ